MLDALVGGTVQGTPQRRPGKAETTFVTARVRALAGDNDTVVLVTVIVVDEAAGSALLALADGDAVSLAGSITPKVWIDKQGIARPAIDMVAQQVKSPDQLQQRQAAAQQHGHGSLQGTGQ